MNTLILVISGFIERNPDLNERFWKVLMIADSNVLSGAARDFEAAILIDKDGDGVYENEFLLKDFRHIVDCLKKHSSEEICEIRKKLAR